MADPREKDTDYLLAEFSAFGCEKHLFWLVGQHPSSVGIVTQERLDGHSRGRGLFPFLVMGDQYEVFLCSISIVIRSKKWNLFRSVCNNQIALTEQKIHRLSLKNHRTVEFGRNLWTSPGPTPCSARPPKLPRTMLRWLQISPRMKTPHLPGQSQTLHGELHHLDGHPSPN